MSPKNQDLCAMNKLDSEKNKGTINCAANESVVTQNNTDEMMETQTNRLEIGRV